MAIALLWLATPPLAANVFAPVATPPLVANALSPLAAVPPVPPKATALFPVALTQPNATAPWPFVSPPPIATEEDPLAWLWAPIATVATLPLALVTSPFFKPIAKPCVLWKATPELPSLNPARSPLPLTAFISCTAVVIANVAKILATTIFFFPVVFLAISDTTT